MQKGNPPAVGKTYKGAANDGAGPVTTVTLTWYLINTGRAEKDAKMLVAETDVVVVAGYEAPVHTVSAAAMHPTSVTV